MQLALVAALVSPCLPALATPAQEEPASEVLVVQALKSKASMAATRASAWLVAQQQPDGSWKPSAAPVAVGKTPNGLTDDEFWDEVLKGGTPATEEDAPAGPDRGQDVYSVGVTGLALLSLCANGQAAEGAAHRAAVEKATGWLMAQQDTASGLIGQRLGFAFVYDHAIATLALLAVHEADPTIGTPASLRGLTAPTGDVAVEGLELRIQRAMNFIARARNPYRVWRYDVPPNGDNDTSVTAWMTLAHAAAQRQGIPVDVNATPAILEWMDEMTEEGTGRVGYTERGSVSSRIPGVNDQFAVTDTETLTAAGLLCRLELGQAVRAKAAVAHVKCMLRSLPDDGAQVDDALWVFFGTRALARVQSRPWEVWSERVLEGALGAQASEGLLAGSWEPKTAWAYASGRIGTTALMSLAASAALN